MFSIRSINLKLPSLNSRQLSVKEVPDKPISSLKLLAFQNDNIFRTYAASSLARFQTSSAACGSRITISDDNIL